MTKTRDDEIDPKFREMMNRLAATLDIAFNGSTKSADRTTGFVLLVFPLDEVNGEGRTNYISNAERRDIVVMLKSLVRRFEGQPEMRGTA